MLDANVKIIQQLKSFLIRVSGDAGLTRQFSQSENDFTRNRKLPFDRLVLLITRLCKKTLSVELEKFFAELNVSMPCTTSAFSQRRIKLDPSFFYCWNMVLWLNYYLHYGEKVKRWKEYRLIAADGSGICLVNNDSLNEYFGGLPNQSGFSVQGKTFYCYDVLNQMILHPRLCPFRYGELNMAYDLVDHLEADMLMIYDRNFHSYKMVALHQFQEREIKFIIRARETRKLIREFIESKARSAEVMMPPTRDAIRGLRKSGYIVDKNTLLRVRLIRVELKDNKVEVLMTNLWEEDGHATDEFKKLYSMRWGIETNIGFQKNIMQLESFSGLTPTSVLQDFHATVLVANLHSLLIKDAQQTISETTAHRKYPMKVNNNRSFGKMKSVIVQLFLNSDPKQILLQLHDYFIRAPLPVRKGRTFKRERKNRHTNSKYRTFTNFKPAY